MPQFIVKDDTTPNFTPVTVTEDGEAKTVYIASPWWYTGVGGDEVQLPYGGRSYLSVTDYDTPEGFYKPNLLGGSIEYDMDLSQMTCGCIAALYLVRSPAHYDDGSYDSTDGFYYCDAQAVGGEYCPEFDIMEANQYAYQTTAHPCYTSYNGHYTDNCEHGGLCIQNSVDNWNHSGINNYGPGSWYQIDTTKEFHVKIEFMEENGQFQQSQTTLTQGSNSVAVGCNDDSNHSMTDDLSNMIITLSSWGSPDANWLWKDSCYGSCGDPTLTFSNLTVNTNGAPTPGPAPGPAPTPTPSGDYDYGDNCSTSSDDYCDGSCDCRWSWPTDDPAKWASDDAACRCKA
jgi:hypothetical protein